MGNHVFICYSRKDEDFVLKLAANLKNRGVPVWLDQWNIPSGANWDRTIEKALHECSRLLLVLSPSSVNSDEVQCEWRSALDEKKVVVPVLYQPCDMPYRLTAIQYIDFTSGSPDDKEALENILNTLEAADNTAAKPVSQPEQITGKLLNASAADIKMQGKEKVVQVNGGNVPAKNQKIIVAIGCILLVLFIAALYFIPPPGPKPAPDPAPIQMGANIIGTIIYNGQPITNYTNAKASIQLIDEGCSDGSKRCDNATRAVDFSYNNENGQFTIRNVTPGKYTANIKLDSGYPFNSNISEAGDYVSFLPNTNLIKEKENLNTGIIVPPNKKDIKKDLKVVYAIHLIKPIDNQKRTNKLETLYTNWEPKSAYIFEWEPVPGAANYSVQIYTDMSGAGQKSNSTRFVPKENYFTLSETGNWSFEVNALNSDDEKIGFLGTWNKDGFLGRLDYRVETYIAQQSS